MYSLTKKPSLGELWQYVKVPVTWTDSGSDSQTLGVTGYVMSGGTVYDHRSSPFGDLASYYEWDSLDPSFGHSDQNKQYHYHAVSTYQKCKLNYHRNIDHTFVLPSSYFIISQSCQ